MSTIVRRIGRYVLLEPVGRGAMGIVYRAEDPLIRRTVAVKVFRPTEGSTPEQAAVARERFVREAQAAGSIDHPNVIRILDVGEDDESAEMYIVMEYVPGPNLEAALRDPGLDRGRAVELIGQIASGLDAAHAQKIVHRDIKPSNILLAEDGTAKIGDFGITQIASSTLTQDVRGLGTPAYMSPEQVEGRVLEPRADLFSLGVLSYEMLAGRRPFEGTDALSTAYAIAHAEAVPISVANASLPQALDAVMERMLAKDPQERFASGREFHEAVVSCMPEADTSRRKTPAFRSNRTWLFWGLAGAALATAVMSAVSSLDRPVAPAPEPSPSKSAARPAVPPAHKAASRPIAPPANKAAAEPAAPPASVAIRLVHRMRHGTLVVSLDGVSILSGPFSKSRLALLQTTTWDAIKAPAGGHKLQAKVIGDDGKTYLSDIVTVELPRGLETALRIGFKGDALTVKQKSG